MPSQNKLAEFAALFDCPLQWVKQPLTGDEKGESQLTLSDSFKPSATPG